MTREGEMKTIQQWMKEDALWMREYVQTPKVTVQLPSGGQVIYHESNDRLRKWHKEMAKELRLIQESQVRRTQ